MDSTQKSSTAFLSFLGLEPGKSMKTQANYSNMVVEFPYIGPTSIKLVH